MRVARGVGESCTQLELVHGGMPDRADHSLKAGRMEFVLHACVFQVYKRPLYSQVSVFESSELNTKANIQAVRRPGRSSPKLLCLLFSIFLLACGVRASD